jgi:protein involved in polysaccharide export with SLBB domain
MNRISMKVVAALYVAAIVVAGCGGGNRFISNRGGAVERGELDLDNIPQRPVPKEYVINQGDGLDILFLYNSEFNQVDLKVRPDGKISLPYAGDVVAAGRPVSELDSVLIARFAEIIVDPEITVVVRSFRPLVVYALGQVSNPGGYEFKPGMTLTNLLALSSGPGPKGKWNEVVVIRRISQDHIVGIEIDLGELLKGKRFDLDIPLQAFDIVYVPKSKLGSGQDFAVALKDLLTSPAEIYLKGWQVANIKTFYDYYKRSGIVP